MSANRKYKQYRQNGGTKTFVDWLNEQQSMGDMEVHEDKHFFNFGVGPAGVSFAKFPPTQEKKRKASGTPVSTSAEPSAPTGTEMEPSTEKPTKFAWVPMAVLFTVIVVGIAMPLISKSKN